VFDRGWLSVCRVLAKKAAERDGASLDPLLPIRACYIHAPQQARPLGRSLSGFGKIGVVFHLIEPSFERVNAPIYSNEGRLDSGHSHFKISNVIQHPIDLGVQPMQIKSHWVL